MSEAAPAPVSAAEEVEVIRKVPCVCVCVVFCVVLCAFVLFVCVCVCVCLIHS